LDHLLLSNSLESDCHPNIDKQSWFRMKHRSRVEREARDETEAAQLSRANKQDQERIDELTVKMAEEEDDEDREALEEEMKDLESAVEKREARLADMEKNKKWNVDNMCHVVEERTIVSKEKDTLTTSELPPDLAAAKASREAIMSAQAASSSDGAAAGAAAPASGAAAAGPAAKPASGGGSVKAVSGPVTERTAVESYATFTEKHEALLEKYSNATSMEETQALLVKHGDLLLQENASSYLLLSCLEEEMNGQKKQMKQVARQSQIQSHIIELGVSLRRPSRDVVVPFFRRIAEPEHGGAFKEAVDTFIARIQKRAIDKRKEMDEAAAKKKAAGGAEDESDEEREELSREERMGPGGLDPVDVFESLPEVSSTNKTAAPFTCLSSNNAFRWSRHQDDDRSKYSNLLTHPHKCWFCSILPLPLFFLSPRPCRRLSRPKTRML
jgi:cell division cycle protein 37